MTPVAYMDICVQLRERVYPWRMDDGVIEELMERNAKRLAEAQQALGDKWLLKQPIERKQS